MKLLRGDSRNTAGHRNSAQLLYCGARNTAQRRESARFAMRQKAPNCYMALGNRESPGKCQIGMLEVPPIAEKVPNCYIVILRRGEYRGAPGKFQIVLWHWKYSETPAGKAPNCYMALEIPRITEKAPSCYMAIGLPRSEKAPNCNIPRSAEKTPNCYMALAITCADELSNCYMALKYRAPTDRRIVISEVTLYRNASIYIYREGQNATKYRFTATL